MKWHSVALLCLVSVNVQAAVTSSSETPGSDTNKENLRQLFFQEENKTYNFKKVVSLVAIHFWLTLPDVKSIVRQTYGLIKKIAAKGTQQNCAKLVKKQIFKSAFAEGFQAYQGRNLFGGIVQELSLKSSEVKKQPKPEQKSLWSTVTGAFQSGYEYVQERVEYVKDKAGWGGGEWHYPKFENEVRSAIKDMYYSYRLFLDTLFDNEEQLDEAIDLYFADIKINKILFDLYDISAAGAAGTVVGSYDYPPVIGQTNLLEAAAFVVAQSEIRDEMRNFWEAPIAGELLRSTLTEDENSKQLKKARDAYEANVKALREKQSGKEPSEFQKDRLALFKLRQYEPGVWQDTLKESMQKMQQENPHAYRYLFGVTLSSNIVESVKSFFSSEAPDASKKKKSDCNVSCKQALIAFLTKLVGEWTGIVGYEAKLLRNQLITEIVSLQTKNVDLEKLLSQYGSLEQRFYHALSLAGKKMDEYGTKAIEIGRTAARGIWGIAKPTGEFVWNRGKNIWSAGSTIGGYLGRKFLETAKKDESQQQALQA